MAASISYQGSQAATGGGPFTLSFTVASAAGQERLVALLSITNNSYDILTFTGVQIDGQTATQVGSYARAKDSSANNGPVGSFWRASGTANTSIDVTFSIGAGVPYDARAVLWSLNDAGTLLDHIEAAIFHPPSGDLSFDVDTAANGATAAAFLAYNSSTRATTWTGLTERLDSAHNLYGTDFISAADLETSSASTPLTVGATRPSDLTNGAMAGLAVSFNPTTAGGQQIIDVGAAPNDGTGDPLRDAFTKSNDNFTELYGAEYITAAADPALTNERVLTDTATVTWDASTPGQIKANATVTGGVPTTRTITAGAGLTGGGDLSADRTLDVGAGTGITVNANDVALTVPVSIANGGTGSTTAGGALTSLGGGNVSNSGTPTAGQLAQWTDATHIQGVNSAVLGFGPPQGRLTLAYSLPVLTTTITNSSNIYYVPFRGDRVPIFDGTNWSMIEVPAITGVTTTTTDTTKNPAAIGASKCNDWFLWQEGSTLRLGHGPDWTSDSARSAGTALTMVNGILLNNVAITNGPAAQRGTYVGTTRSNASSTLDWQLPSVGSGVGNAILGVWNAYNRVHSGGYGADTTASWTYNSATIRQRRAATTAQVQFVSGLAEDLASMTISQLVANNADGTTAAIGIGVDTTTAFTGPIGQGSSAPNVVNGSTAGYTALSLGNHIWTANEACINAVTVTFYGALAGPPARQASGYLFNFPM